MSTQIIYIKAPQQILRNTDIAVLLPCVFAEADGDYLDRCRALSRKQARTALVTAPFLYGGRLCMAWLCGEDVVLQPACFAPEGNAGYQKGSDVQVFDTGFGRIAMAVGYDVFQPQYARLAALRGCQILFCGVGHLDSEQLVLAGPWSVAQANNLAVSVAGEQRGQLLLPCALTPGQSGFSPDGRVAPKDIDAAYRAFPVFDSLNTEFYRKYRKELVQGCSGC
jgi:hypothetical protein